MFVQYIMCFDILIHHPPGMYICLLTPFKKHSGGGIGCFTLMAVALHFCPCIHSATDVKGTQKVCTQVFIFLINRFLPLMHSGGSNLQQVLYVNNFMGLTSFQLMCYAIVLLLQVGAMHAIYQLIRYLITKQDGV